MIIVIKTILRNSLALFSRRQNSILSAATVIMVTVFFSRILGLARDRLLVAYFSPDELGVYFAAFRLPNLLFELLVMGALSTAFIPVFTRLLVNDSEKDAFRLGAQVINVSIIIVGLLGCLLALFAQPLSYLLVPKFSASERTLWISFTQIMLLGQLIPLVIGNFVTGMLQSFQRFVLPSIAPIVYNMGIIAGAVFLSPIFGLYGAVWGVVAGAVLFLVIQIPLVVKLGYRHELTIDVHNSRLREVGRLMLPRTFGLAVSQIDTTVDLILASLLGTRAITIFHYAQHLQQVPIGLFGATFAQAALPSLSGEMAKKDLPAFKQLFLASMHQILFFVLPASMMLIILRTPMVRLVFGATKFDWPATVATSQTLSFFAISIFAQSLVQLYARAFYALYDTKTPVVIGVVAVLINTGLSLLFILVWQMEVAALAISASIANIINALFLLIFLYRRIGGFDLKQLLLPPIKMGFAALVTGIFLYVPLKLFDQLVFDTTRGFDLLLLTGVASFSGLSVYIFLAWFLDIEEVATFFKLLQKVRRVPRVFFSQSTELVNGDQPSIS